MNPKNEQDLRQQFGLALRRLRESARLNIAGLARQVKVSPAWLSYVENGQRMPSWNFITACVSFLEKIEVSRGALTRLRATGRRLVMQKAFAPRATKAVIPTSPSKLLKNPTIITRNN
ncbi:MAG: helix-turn-helix domain-containing protein [Elusimicrobia bacterium]|nr:helix-turn-helix domain-containing protein [Elusimicrobiota bacterium]